MHFLSLFALIAALAVTISGVHASPLHSLEKRAYAPNVKCVSPLEGPPPNWARQSLEYLPSVGYWQDPNNIFVAKFYHNMLLRASYKVANNFIWEITSTDGKVFRYWLHVGLNQDGDSYCHLDTDPTRSIASINVFMPPGAVQD